MVWKYGMERDFGMEYGNVQMVWYGNFPGWYENIFHALLLWQFRQNHDNDRLVISISYRFHTSNNLSLAGLCSDLKLRLSLTRPCRHLFEDKIVVQFAYEGNNIIDDY